ncbi:MAG: hypothetical protein ACI35T_04180 [Alistipes sp.]
MASINALLPTSETYFGTTLKKSASDGSRDIDSEPIAGKQNGTAPLQDTFPNSKGNTISSKKQETSEKVEGTEKVK